MSLKCYRCGAWDGIGCNCKDNQTIFLGDCREILPELPKVDLVLTDPPYGIGFASQPTKWQRGKGMRPEKWDDTAPDISNLLSHCEAMAVWGGNHFHLPKSRGWLVWIKPDAPPSMSTIELCWTSRDANARHITHSISATNKERVKHPTQKPLRVIRWTIQEMGESTTVLDPFLGSGTTLRACKDLGRRGIGIELEEKYCEIAAERLRQGVLL